MIKSNFRMVKRGVCALLAAVMCVGTTSVSAFAASSSTATPTTPIKQIDVPVEDGVYYADVNLWHASSNQASMGNASLRGSSSWLTKHPEDTSYEGAIIVVKDNKATALVEYMPMGFLGTYGFMYELESVNAKYLQQWGGIYDENDENSPVYTSTQTLTRHMTTEGKVVYDNYNNPSSEYVYDGSEDKSKRPAGYGYTEERTINISDAAYSHLISVDVTPITIGDNEVPTAAADYTYQNAAYVHVFVPVMFSIMPSSGDQYARMKVDWTSLQKIENPEENLTYALYSAKQIEQDNYTNVSYQNLQTAISNVTEKLENVWPSQDLEMSGSGFSAQPVINLKEYTDEEKSEMAKTLNDAVSALEELGDKTTLNSLIEMAEQRNESLYTDDSFKNLTDVLEAAKAVQSDADAGATAVKNAEQSLTDAIMALVYCGADYSAVDAALLSVPADLSVYTDETVRAVTDAVNAVDYTLDVTEQEEIAAMAEAVTAAVDALVYKEADYTAVDKAIESVPTDMSAYTAESAEAVNNAVSAVVRGKNITEQADVDAMAKAIEDAVNNLTIIVVGDVNGDNIVDITDATQIQKHAAQIITLTGDRFTAADVNGDNIVDITDATQIQKYVAQIIKGFN